MERVTSTPCLPSVAYASLSASSLSTRKRDVTEPPHPGRLPPGGRGILDGEQVDRVALPLERHEDAAVLGVFLQHREPEDLGVELLGGLQIEHAQQDVADSRETDHG